MPRTTTPVLARDRRGDTFGVGNSVYFAFAILLVVTFVLKKTVVGRRFEAIGANPWPHAPLAFTSGVIR